MFYNTTHESGATLRQFRATAQAQTERVLDFYRAHPGELFGPSEVWRRTGLEAEEVPLTNVRRAVVTDATKAGILVMTTVKRPGAYMHPEHCWVYPAGGRMVSGGDLLL